MQSHAKYLSKRTTNQGMPAQGLSGSAERRLRLSCSIPDNVSGLIQSAADECIEQLKKTNDIRWFELGKRLKEMLPDAVGLGGYPKEPAPRGRKSAMLKRIEQERTGTA